MIFKKYQNKINTSILKKKNFIISKFNQKPIRNTNLFLKESFLFNNQSIFENKIKFNNIKLDKNRLNTSTNLQKKKII
jgi:hypothetical protein